MTDHPTTEADYHVIVAGNIADGFTVYGPVIPNERATDDFIDDELRNVHWVMVPLEPLTGRE